jgi:hypothetical protein
VRATLRQDYVPSLGCTRARPSRHRQWADSAALCAHFVIRECEDASFSKSSHHCSRIPQHRLGIVLWHCQSDPEQVSFSSIPGGCSRDPTVSTCLKQKGCRPSVSTITPSTSARLDATFIRMTAPGGFHLIESFLRVRSHGDDAQRFNPRFASQLDQVLTVTRLHGGDATVGRSAPVIGPHTGGSVDVDRWKLVTSLRRLLLVIVADRTMSLGEIRFETTRRRPRQRECCVGDRWGPLRLEYAPNHWRRENQAGRSPLKINDLRPPPLVSPGFPSWTSPVRVRSPALQALVK